jgi:CubicO group peptidase (beta-lactamase class C family)
MISLCFARRMQYLPVSAPFRQTFLYSNMGALLAAAAMETLGGVGWEQLMTDFLLYPLQMNNTVPLTGSKDFRPRNLSGLYVPVEGMVTEADGSIFESVLFSLCCYLFFFSK